MFTIATPAQPGAAGREGPYLTWGAGGSSTEGVTARAPVGIRDHYRERRAWENHTGLARGSSEAPPVGAHAPGPARVVHRSSCLEQRSDCACFPRPVECGGTIPESQKRRGCILGAIASVGRHLFTVAHVRDGDWFDVGQLGAPDPGQPEVRK